MTFFFIGGTIVSLDRKEEITVQVPVLTIVFVIINMLLGIAIPLAAALFFYKKYYASWLSFFTGCAVMLLFALILEQLVHGLVLGSAMGSTILNSIWLYALYGGLMAGLFEETGRLLAMKLVLRRHHDNNGNALMYAVGHGGFEVFAILTVANLNNLIYSVMLNTGNAQALLAPLDAANQAVLQNAFQTLASTSPFLFLLSPVERLAALLAHIGLSVIVWVAATRPGKIRFYFLAVFLHFALDALSAVLSRLGVNMLLVEAAVWVMALVIAAIARKVKAENP